MALPVGKDGQASAGSLRANGTHTYLATVKSLWSKMATWFDFQSDCYPSSNDSASKKKWRQYHLNVQASMNTAFWNRGSQVRTEGMMGTNHHVRYESRSPVSAQWLKKMIKRCYSNNGGITGWPWYFCQPGRILLDSLAWQPNEKIEIQIT